MISLAAAVFVTTGSGTGGFVYVGSRVSSQIRSHYFLGLLRQPISYFDHTGAGSCNETLTTSINAIQRGISEKIARTLHALGMFGGAWIIAFVLCWRLAFTLIWAVPVAAILVVSTYKLNNKYNQLIFAAVAKSTGVGEEAFSSIRNVKALGAEDAVVDKFQHHLASATKHAVRQRSIMGITLGVLVCINYLVIALAFWQGSRLLSQGKATFEEVFVVSIVIGTAVFTSISISGNADVFTKALAAAQKVYWLIDQKSKLDPSSTQGRTLQNMEGSIQFRGVKHAYPTRPDNIILQNLDLQFPQGTTTALVGSSGSGKTSIVDLIERFYDPLDGAILLDGYDLTTLKIKWLRQQIGVVNQHPALFAASVFDNIAYGLLRLSPAEEAQSNESIEKRHVKSRVERAAKIADCHNFIELLPQRYDTLVGNTSLSGGQRQRIALARALVSNPKILILDEATSAVDTESEERIVSALNEDGDFRTTIIIAHRLSTIRAADNIVVLDHGCIVEQGSHEKLFGNQGAYYNLLQTGESPEEESAMEIETASRVHSLSSSRQSYHTKSEHENGVGHYGSTEVLPLTNEPIWTLIKFIMTFNAHDILVNVIGVVCSVLMSVEEAVNAILFGEAITALALPVSEYPEMLSKVGFWALMFMTLAFVQLLAFVSQGVSLSIASERMVQRVKVETLRRILRQDISTFDNGESSVGAMLNLLSTETVNMCSLSGATLGMFLTVLMTLVTCFIVACIFGWKLALVVTATVPIILCCMFLNISLLRKFQDKTNILLQVAATDAVEAVSEIKTIALLSMERHSADKYNESLHVYSKHVLINSIKLAFVFGVSQAFPFLCMALGLWYGFTLVENGELTPVQFLVAYSAVIFGARSAGATLGFAEETNAALQAARQLSALWKKVPEIDTWDIAPHALSNIRGDLMMQGINFRYEGGQHLVLKNLTLRFNAGNHIALVGPSGSGKSTVIALLERFYDPIFGGIFLDGINIKDVNINNYRKFIALVSQDVALYDGTIRENLILGLPAELVTDEAIENALRSSNLAEFIASLPDGLSTQLGTKGGLLSGGQKQRLSIARALLRDAKILLLDESTSALDAVSEAVILQALKMENGRRTVVTVAHRLNTVVGADWIYVLDGGRIAEEGKHADLLRRRGRYYDLVSGQMSGGQIGGAQMGA